MNTTWHLRCADCNRKSNMSFGGNESENQLKAFLENWKLIRAVYNLTHDEVSIISLTDMASEDGILSFMHRHDGHDVFVENSHGQSARSVGHVEKEIILSIEEVSDRQNGGSIITQGGFSIKTNKQEVLLLIDDYQSCCESWGYFMVDESDDIQRFIGAELLDIKLTDNFLKPIDFEININYGGGIMFVDLVTNIGVLQFVAYNEHNGYYGHEAVVKSTQLEYEVSL